MLNVFEIQNGILLVGALALFAVEAWALVDSVSHKSEAYIAADKQTKPMWVIILAVAFAAHVIFWNPIALLNIAGAIASLVYLLDVRPAIRSLTRR